MKLPVPPSHAKAARSEGLSWVPTPRQFFVILAVYFTLHLALRTAVSETIGVDESDQVVLGQHWSWGYGPQPPLFTWLAMAAMKVVGPSVFALTLLREALLLAISLLMYCNGRMLIGSHAGGLAAAAALQFHPTIVWESQRELTHSIPASALVLAMFLVFFQLRPGCWGAYLIFGLLGGLAVLSKYNALIMYAAMLLAALSLPAWRGRVLDWRMGAALGVSLLVLWPNLEWVASHRATATASMWKFHIDHALPWTTSVVEGLKIWFETLGAHLVAVVLVFLLVFWGPVVRGEAWRKAGAEARFLWRVFLAICLLAVGSVLIFRVTDFRDRWLQPLLITVPLLLAVAMQASLDARRLKLLLAGGVAVSALVLLAAPGRILLTERLHKSEVLNAPFRKLAPAVAPLAREADLVVSDDRWLLANIHLWFPDRLCLTPDLLPVYRPAGRRCLLVWRANRKLDAHRSLGPFIRRYCGQDAIPNPVYVSAVWKYHHTKRFQLGFATLDRGTNQFYAHTALADPAAPDGGGL